MCVNLRIKYNKAWKNASAVICLKILRQSLYKLFKIILQLQKKTLLLYMLFFPYIFINKNQTLLYKWKLLHDIAQSSFISSL